MQDEQNYNQASDILKGVVDNHPDDYITLEQIKIALSERGFGFFMIFFSLPMCVPAIPPGLTMILAIPLLIFALQMTVGMRSPLIPKFIANKKIKRQTLAKIIEKTSPYLKRVENLLKPRFSFAASKQGEQLIGIFCIVCAISIANPLPATNMVPSIGITLMSLGLLGKDGVFIILGMIVGILGVLFGIMFTIAVLTGVSSGAEGVLGFIGL